jgi:cytochrome bd ubiquinol oxidase subunit II
VGLEGFWFCLIGVLWGGYFLLEGFDFGVGLLLPVLPRDERECGMMFDAIGPVWDGNEVWVVVAAGATFAAFPAWYATMFSGFYIALLLILVLLIVRVVAFEWRGKRDGPRWRATWLWANAIGSLGAAFLWGLTLTNLLHGVPLNSSHVFSGDFFDLFSAYTVVAGLAVVALFAIHGATYLTLRTAGDFRARAATMARRLSIPAVVLGIGIVVWTVVVAHDQNRRGVLPTAIPAAITAVALVLALGLTRVRRSGWAFPATALAAVGFVATIFTGLYPRVLVSNPIFANSLTISNAASGHYPLQVITIVATIFTPLVLLYQSWTYYVFRKRLGGEQVRTRSRCSGAAAAAPRPRSRARSRPASRATDDVGAGLQARPI